MFLYTLSYVKRESEGSYLKNLGITLQAMLIFNFDLLRFRKQFFTLA